MYLQAAGRMLKNKFSQLFVRVQAAMNNIRVIETDKLAILKLWVKEHWITLVLVFFPTSFLLLILLVAGLHFFAGVDLPFLEFKNSTSAAYWGQLGDFFGGMLNPILSFAALMSVVYGLNLQRKDLIEARKEATKANTIQGSQTGIYRRQSVEASLLTLITLHLKVVEDMSFHNGHGKLSGRAAIEGLVKDYFRLVDAYVQKVKYRELTGEEFDGVDSAEKLSKLPFVYTASLGDTNSRYMRSIFQVMKFIDSRVEAYDYVGEEVMGHDVKVTRRFRMNYVEKRQFSNILRSQLSENELILIFLNSLSPQGEGLRYYVEKYSLLKGLNEGLFSDHPGLINNIDKSAFADYEDLDMRMIFELERKHEKEVRRRAFQRAVSPGSSV